MTVAFVGSGLSDRVAALLAICRMRGLAFSLEYSEAEDAWSASAYGVGVGEGWEVKRTCGAFQAVDDLIGRILEDLP